MADDAGEGKVPMDQPPAAAPDGGDEATGAGPVADGAGDAGAGGGEGAGAGAGAGSRVAAGEEAGAGGGKEEDVYTDMPGERLATSHVLGCRSARQAGEVGWFGVLGYLGIWVSIVWPMTKTLKIVEIRVYGLSEVGFLVDSMV